ncbi:MAG: efflux RND transporter periplasmic adaptor subunit [Bacillota bacterium]
MATSPRLPLPLLALTLSAALLAGCSHGSTVQTPAKPVIAEHLGLTDTTPRDEYSGDVHARYESALGFRVPGKIVARYVNLGDSVQAGQLLAKLDAADAELNHDAAQAALAAAKSSYETAQRELARYEALIKTGAVSRSAFEHQQDLFTTAQANYQQAQRAFELRGNQLAYTELRADHAGVVTAVDAEAGQVVAEGQTVMSLAWSDGREVYIDVPENRIGDFDRAQDIKVTLWGTPGQGYLGHVRERAASADPATRTFLVKIALRNPGPEVKLGMTAAVAVADAVDPEELLLPLSALYHKDTATAAWVVDPKTSKLVLKPVQVLRYTDAGVVIGAGLEPGDTVVLKGVNELYEGESAQALLPAPAPAKAGGL